MTETIQASEPTEDFSFGGSPEEVEEAVKRNQELADKGFALSNTEDESLRPKMFDENEVQTNSIEAKVDLGDKTPKAELPDGWDTFGEMPIGMGQFVPKKDENIWKQLYFSQKGIIGSLELLVEELYRELHDGKS